MFLSIKDEDGLELVKMLEEFLKHGHIAYSIETLSTAVHVRDEVVKQSEYRAARREAEANSAIANTDDPTGFDPDCKL